MAYAPQMPVMALPPDVYQSAMAAQLGDQPRSEYRVTTTVKRIIAAIVLLVIGILLGAIGLGGLSDGSDSGLSVAVIFGLVGLFLIAMAFYYFLYGVIYKNWGVYIYDYGFVDKRGSQAAQPFRWDQVEAVWYQVTRHYRNGIYTGTTHRYRVRRQDGYEIVLNDRFTKVGELGDLVSNRVTNAKLPQVMAAYNAGQTVTFGPLSISRQGIQNSRGNLLPWMEIKDVSLQNGYVAVSKAGKWLNWSTQPVREIPNVFLFVAAVRSILGK